MLLANRVAIVTGGAGVNGLGFASARMMAEQGAKVVIIDLAAASAAKAAALLGGRTYVSPHDVKSIAVDVLRHRILPSYEAEAQGKTSDHLVAQILENVAVP